MADWFRKVSWSKSDQEDFWAHHKRARAHGKAQYLRIQASHLARTKKPELEGAALTLLNLLIADFPDSSELACAYWQRAQIHSAEGRKELAISDYRAAIAREREFPRAKTGAWLDFGWFAVTSRWDDVYDEVLAILAERQADALFPVDYFRLNAVRSIIAAERGDPNGARQFAAEALRQAARVHSGFRYHSTLGLVGEMRGPVFDQLRTIQNG
jgi:tetratricopeptide (TPR) repeat protein